jgi:N-acetylglucosaminyldiphosphoundecaprenol N-acetyl-beta-D-mannosaminyltransferase
MPNVAHIEVLGVPIGAFTMQSLLARMEELIAQPGCAVAYAANAHALNLTYRHPEYLEALRGADIVYADGASILLAALCLGQRLPQRLCTTDVWPRACELAASRGYRCFLLGGKPGIAERVKDAAMLRYPGLKIAGTHHGFFDFDDERVLRAINAVRPHILWVGMGDPRQALWTERVKARLEAGLVVTCGAMFRFISGELKRLPGTWNEYGLEWLSRLMQDPGHTWRRYLLGLPLFGARVVAQRLGGHRRATPPRVRSARQP